MTRSEFNEILNRTHEQAIKNMCNTLKELSDSEKRDPGTLMAELSISSVETAENAIIHALDEAGFLPFSG